MNLKKNLLKISEHIRTLIEVFEEEHGSASKKKKKKKKTLPAYPNFERDFTGKIEFFLGFTQNQSQHVFNISFRNFVLKFQIDRNNRTKVFEWKPPCLQVMMLKLTVTCPLQSYKMNLLHVEQTLSY